VTCEQCQGAGTVPMHTEGLGFRELAVCGMCAPAKPPRRQLQIVGASQMEKPDFILYDCVTCAMIERADSIEAAQTAADRLAREGRSVKLFAWVHVATFSPKANG